MKDEMPTFKILKYPVKMETILFFYEWPIFGLCKSPRDQYYLAYSYTPENAAWILAQVSRTTIVDMFNNKVSMYDVMQNAKEKWIGEEDELFQKVDHFSDNELPKKNAMYGHISSLEIDLIKRLTDETVAINRHEAYFTKKELEDAIKDMKDDDQIQVMVNYNCYQKSIDNTSHFQDTFECQRITGIDVRTLENPIGKVEKIAELYIDLTIG